MSETDADEKVAQKALVDIGLLVDEMLRVMEKCPYNDVFDRVAALVGMMRNFDDGNARMAAGVAIERLTHFQQMSLMGQNVEVAEQLMLELMATFMMTGAWTSESRREKKITSMATGILQACSPSQLAMMAAVAITRQMENETGPADQ